MIIQGVRKKEKAPPQAVCFQDDEKAAQEAIESGLYVTWVPGSNSILGKKASDDVKSDQVGQCCRVSISSSCLCGHALEDHLPNLKLPRSKSPSYIRAPSCTVCAGCHCFRYCPLRPEECGQVWLQGRKNFDILEWRKRVRQHPYEYACIGCDTAVADHETCFERVVDRESRGAAVGDAFRPLADRPALRTAVQRYQRLSTNAQSVKIIENGNDNDVNGYVVRGKKENY